MAALYTKKKIITEYRRLLCQFEKIPTINDLRNNGYKQLEKVIYRKFGKLTNLRKAANIIEERNPPGYWTVAKVISDLRKFCRTNKKAIQQEAIGSLLLRKGKKNYVLLFTN